jgi:hypothetical protein
MKTTRQLGLFDAPAKRPRRAVKQPDPPPERLGDGDDDDDQEFDPAHERLCRDCEKLLRDKGWPYVAVDEAKTAIFGNAKIGAFDFLVYSSAGPNLLVMLRADEGPVGAEPLATMKEWQKVFGEGFEALFACGTRAVTLAEYGRTGWTNAQEIELLV